MDKCYLPALFASMQQHKKMMDSLQPNSKESGEEDASQEK
jgi:hypothetical protein